MSLKSRRNKASKAYSFEEKLAQLEKCGIAAPHSYSSLADLLSTRPVNLRNAAYHSLLFYLGRNSMSLPGSYCPQLAAFYENGIEGDNDYLVMMGMLAEQTRGALALSDMSVHFPPEARSSFVPFHPARIEFKCNGRAYEYNFVQELDWIDMKLIEVIAALLIEKQSELYYFLLLIEDIVLVGCLTLEQISRLRSLEGLKGIRLLSGRLPIEGLREL